MKKLASLIISLLYASNVFAFDTFKVKDIRLEGLQRISVGTVFNYLPVKVGEEFSKEEATQAIRALYKTGFFKDVRLEREGDVLVVFVAERPAVAEINISGNDELATDQLKSALKDMGLVEGRVFDKAILEIIERELKRQYYSLGKYGVKVTTEAKPLERNRIAINIDIAEGEEAEVYAINIVGNKTYKNEELLALLNLGESGIFGGREKYSKQILAGDLEALRSHYMDKGHINFSIDSTQVALTPDKQDVYVTVNISEGDVFTVRDVKLIGKIIILAEEMNELVLVSKGELFSRKKVTDTRKNLSDRLAELGYPFANVNVAPEIDNDSRTVKLNIYIDPGRRVYVRKVNIAGNAKTSDEVIRRELRQLENDWLSTERVAQSQSRLNRTGFFSDVSVKTPAVPGTLDQVDLNVDVEERATGSLTFGLGVSDTQGVALNFSLSQDNFLGSGKKVSVTIDNGSVTKQYSLSVTNPYYTIDGVSRSLSFVAREVDAEEADISNYIINSNSVNLSYGIPLSETTRTNLGLSYEQTELVTGTTTATEITDYINQNNGGESEYGLYKIAGSWVRDTRNKAIIADEGSRTILSYEASIPGSDLEFYKVGMDFMKFFTIAKGYTFMYKLRLDYGDAYGDTAGLPPFERYFAGGSRTVRGYDGNSLGNPNTKDSNGDPLGGDRRLVTNLELILPNPFSDKNQQMRLTTFIDGGFIWAPGDKLDLGELRYSAGVSLIWLAPVGVMRFSLSEPLNAKPTDDTTSFQFTLGSVF